MKRFEFRVTRALYRHRGTRSDRTVARQAKEARQMLRELHARGYKVQQVSEIGGKAVRHLQAVWAGEVPSAVTGRMEALALGTRRTYLSTLRTLCRLAGKPTLVPKTNFKAGVPRVSRIRAENPAWSITADQVEALDAAKAGQNVALSMRVQNAFGLRKSEAWLMNARRCHQGAWLLVDRGKKGTAPDRWVPVRTQAQRELLEEVKAANDRTPRGTLIVENQKASHDAQKAAMEAVGLRHGHALRFDYAQRRYAELVVEKVTAANAGRPAGSKLVPWECPMRGGRYASTMTAAERQIDWEARGDVSHELGHQSPVRASPYLGGRKP